MWVGNFVRAREIFCSLSSAPQGLVTSLCVFATIMATLLIPAGVDLSKQTATRTEGKTSYPDLPALGWEKWMLRARALRCAGVGRGWVVLDCLCVRLQYEGLRDTLGSRDSEFLVVDLVR